MPSAATRRNPPRSSRSSDEIPAKWIERFALLPGYDPVATAGDCVFLPELADRPREFLGHLRHTKGEWAGQPLKLEEWQAAYLGCLFGWLRWDEESQEWVRRYLESMLYIPRKNGKTTLCAGVGDYVLLCDREPGAECYALASDRDQARLVFDPAKKMIEDCEELASVCETFRNSIVYRSSSFKVISADAGSKHGYNTHFAVVDELHAQKDRDLVEVMQTSTAARRQPLLMYITTADVIRESICNETYEYACQVRDGVIDDPSFLPAIFEASKDDDYADEATWKKANPNYGISVKPDYLRRELEKAKASPARLSTFLRLHLNVRTESEDPWMLMETWDRCDTAPRPLEQLAGQVCYAGLDLSTTTDLTALVLIFPDGDTYDIHPFFWIPRETMRERERRDRIPYGLWSRDGLIEPTDGGAVDYRFIRERVNEFAKRFKLAEVGYDPWNASHLATELSDEDGVTMVEVRQGKVTLNEPTKRAEALVVERKIRHGGNPVLRWMVANTRVDQDHQGNVMPSKKKSRQRIDGVSAMLTGLSRVLANVEKRPSVYARRGALTI